MFGVFVKKNHKTGILVVQAQKRYKGMLQENRAVRKSSFLGWIFKNSHKWEVIHTWLMDLIRVFLQSDHCDRCLYSKQIIMSASCVVWCRVVESWWINTMRKVGPWISYLQKCMNIKWVNGKLLAVCNQILEKVGNLGLWGVTVWSYRGGQRRFKE